MLCAWRRSRDDPFHFDTVGQATGSLGYSHISPDYCLATNVNRTRSAGLKGKI